MNSLYISDSDLALRVEEEVRQLPHIAALRAFNHDMIRNLNDSAPLRDTICLDVGTSVHGFAMEAALTYRPRRFVGIDLGVERHWNARSVIIRTDDPACSGEFVQMDAQALDFRDSTFDVLLSISTFEHFSDPPKALDEMYRVLRPGGTALISFEPVWTASYGHHLHYLPCASLIPPWSHLLLTPEQMTHMLKQHRWPDDCSMSVGDAVFSVYSGPAINRVTLDALKRLFVRSPFEIVWMSHIPEVEDETKHSVATYVSSLLAIPADDLLTRGLSIFLRKS